MKVCAAPAGLLFGFHLDYSFCPRVSIPHYDWTEVAPRSGVSLDRPPRAGLFLVSLRHLRSVNPG